MERNLKGRVATITCSDPEPVKCWVCIGSSEERQALRDMIPKQYNITWGKNRVDIGEFLPNDDKIWRKIPCFVFIHKGEIVKVLS